jgi:hypothetical protein
MADTDHKPEEGWYTDPYGRHEARWLSNGRSTKLVRDGGVESYDEPPDEPPSRTPVRFVEQDRAGSADDLRRADDAESGDTYDQQKATRAALDVLDSTAPGQILI